MFLQLLKDINKLTVDMRMNDYDLNYVILVYNCISYINIKYYSFLSIDQEKNKLKNCVS